MYEMKIRKVSETDAPGLEDWLKVNVERMTRDRKTSVQAIATLAGISSGYLYRMMSGAQEVVSDDVVKNLEEVFGVKYVIGRTEGDLPEE